RSSPETRRLRSAALARTAPMRLSPITLSWFLLSLVFLSSAPAPGSAQEQLPMSGSPVQPPTSSSEPAISLQDRLTNEVMLHPQAQADSQPRVPALAPSQTGTQAAPSAQATTPGSAGTLAQSDQQTGGTPLSQTPVSARPFGMDLIVLPVDHLLGDWYGLRTRLEDQGITPSLTFVSDLAGNPVGGMRRGFTEADNLGLNINFDLDKLYGLKGGSFQFSTSQRSGANLSAIDIGNTFTIQQVYGRETWQVINVAYLQKFLDGKVELRIGRIAAGDVFVVSPYDYVFMQNAI